MSTAIAPGYVDCVKVLANGKTQRGSCKRDRLCSAELAALRLQDGMTVFVAPGDAAALVDMVKAWGLDGR
jgi:hypothetical protein